jgi:hypothetical protein
MPRTACTLAVTAVALAGLLSGCSQEAAQPRPLPSPTLSPNPSPSASASATARPVPPTLPAAARGTSAASAEAFVRHWIAVLNYSAKSGDSGALQGVSAPDCVQCNAIVALIKEVRRGGGVIWGKGWNVQGVVQNASRPGNLRALDVMVFVNQQVVIDKQGGRPQRFEGGLRHKKFAVSQQNGSWLVSRLDQPE